MALACGFAAVVSLEGGGFGALMSLGRRPAFVVFGSVDTELFEVTE